jgi:hypothetical protein
MIRIFLNELKKISNPRVLLLAAVVGTLLFFAFMRTHIDSYNANMTDSYGFNGYGDWQNEMFDLYGPTFSQTMSTG